MLEKLSGYAVLVLAATTFVSSTLHAFKQDEKPWAKPVLALCFNVSGFIKSLVALKNPPPPTDDQGDK